MTKTEFLMQPDDVLARQALANRTLASVNSLGKITFDVRQMRVNPHECPDYERALAQLDVAMDALRAAHGRLNNLFDQGRFAEAEQIMDAEADSEFVCTKSEGCTEFRNGEVVS